MKAISIILIVLALVTAIVPQFTDCQSQGRSVTTADGRQIPMKCHWTAQAAIAVSLPLGIAGILLNRSQKKESRLSLLALSAVLGILIILLPTSLIGVCASNEMLCNMVMKPALIFTGALTLLATAGGYSSIRLMPAESAQ